MKIDIDFRKYFEKVEGELKGYKKFFCVAKCYAPPGTKDYEIEDCLEKEMCNDVTCFFICSESGYA